MGPKRSKLAATTETLNTLEHWLESHVGPPLQPSGTIERMENLSDIDAQADLVMDCIAEDMAQKVELFHGDPLQEICSSSYVRIPSALVAGKDSSMKQQYSVEQMVGKQRHAIMNASSRSPRRWN